MSDMFERLPNCPFFCEGHVDPSVYRFHSTALDYFGTDGPVAVTQLGGGVPAVSLVDLDHPQADFTVTEARLLAYQLLLAADIAERAATPSVTETVTQMLAAALAGTTGGSE